MGIFEDAGITNGEKPKFQAMITDLKARGLGAVMFTNNFANRDAALLDISDPQGIDVYMIPGGDLNQTWWPSNIPANLETARSAAQPIVNVLSPHPSFKGYIVKDEPNLTDLQKVSLITQAFHELDTARPAMPILIGLDRIGPIFNAAQPDVMLIDVYPVGYNNELCDFTMTGFGYNFLDFVDYIRTARQTKPASTPLWIILQTHNFLTQLREPLPVEVRSQYWLAIGEGAKGIFWFIYSSQQGWKGLVDNPPLYSEVTTLAQRTQPFRNMLLGFQKTQDLFRISGSASQAPYISTLASSSNRFFVVAVNRDCAHSQNLTINAITGLTGQLRDMETSLSYNLGTPILFPPGDGKIFTFEGNFDWHIHLPIIQNGQ